MLAQEKNQLHLFQPEDNNAFGTAMRNVGKSRNKHLVDLLKDGYVKKKKTDMFLNTKLVMLQIQICYSPRWYVAK